jgi:hypothetical protein
VSKLLAGVAIVAAGCADPDVVSGPHRLYQVTGEHLPTTEDDARAYGMNDQLGLAFALIVDQGLGDPQGATDRAFMANQVHVVVDVQQPETDAKPTPAAVNTYAGGAHGYDPTSPVQPPLTGTANGSLVSAGPGALAVTVAPFGMPLPITLHGATIELIAGPDELQAVVAGGVDEPTIKNVLAPSWALALAPIVARDCSALTTPPTCGCVTKSPGGDAIAVLDANHDCVLTADELLQNPLVVSATSADLTIDGQPVVSFAFSLDATFVRSVP